MVVQTAESAQVVPAREDNFAFGEYLRDRVPLSAHRLFTPAQQRDPLGLLKSQDAKRLPELLPLRYGRMSRTPFTYYRGSALVMAADLACTPRNGLKVQACGDAHLGNFGFFSSPERELIFDLTDFDETVPGPWEWDVKRLATSIRLAARDNGLGEGRADAAVERCVSRYRTHMAQYGRERVLTVWYAQINRDVFAEKLPKKEVRKTEQALDRIKLKDSQRALRKLTRPDGGSIRMAEKPPVLTHVKPAIERELRRNMAAYVGTLPSERRILLQRFTMVDFARKVVGVGSVGTRCYVVLLQGRGLGDPLFLQIKEAQASCLEGFGFRSAFENHGERVVHGKRALQAASDIFLGWCRVGDHDFYVRQLADDKGRADIENMSGGALVRYAGLCGWALARAHARTGNPARLAGYLGDTPRFDEAIRKFSRTYADLMERDHALLLREIRSGRIPAEDDQSGPINSTIDPA